MKKLLLSAAVSSLAFAAHAEYTLTVLHTNDFHSRFEPITKYDNTCAVEDNDAGECFGGSARLATAITEARGRTNNSILVDGGDQFQGTLFYTYYKGKMAAEMMNRLGYTAMTVGNHEFDDGPEVLAGFADAIDFPILMSNADISAEEHIKDKIEKSVVIEQGGEKIGLIGLTTEDTPEISSPGENVIFMDSVKAVQAEVDRLTAEGVNKIVLLSHSGYHKDIEVAENTTGVDVIVGGHTNTYLANDSEDAEGPYPTMVGDTAIVSAYAYGKFLGELNVTFDDEGKVTEAKGAPLIMDGEVAEEADTKALVAERAQPLEEIRSKVVGEAGMVLDGERANCRMKECLLGNLISDAILERTKDQGIDVAIQNGGGIRASIDEGEVTMGEVLTVLPFQNTLATFQATGQTLIDALENGVSGMGEDPAGSFPQVAGMSYTVDPSQPEGSRISEVMVGGEAIDPAKTYGVVTNNFVRNGGDGYAMFKDAENAYDFGPNLEDVVADYIGQNSPVSVELDGRITVK